MNKTWHGVAALGIVLSSTTCAFAHADPRMIGGSFGAGAVHPLSGWDHLLAMLCIGMLAARIGGAAQWLLPSAFVGSMALGGLVGMTGFAIPLTEFAIAMSLIALGLAVCFHAGFRLPALAVIAAAGGIVHGHVHGTEIPTLADPVVYFIGLTMATCALHATGLALGRALMRDPRGVAAIRWTGAAVALTGGICAILIIS